MLNTITLSALDSNLELSLDDLDLVLGGGANNVSATGAGDDAPQQHGQAVNALDLRTSPVNADVHVSVTSTETHTDGGGPLDLLAQGGQAVLNTVADLGHQAGNIIYDFAHPIAEGAGTLIHDVFLSIDQALPVHTDASHR
jgi:hypothetical protein